MNRSVDSPRPPESLARMFPEAKWTSARIRNAVGLTEVELEHSTQKAYVDLHQAIRDSDSPHVVRMWNFIPQLLDATSDGRDRYMAFNAGRYAGLCDWFGGPEHLVDRAPAASGVGTASADVSIYAMSLPIAGRAIQNPLQIPPVNYSPRFGPRPPCFARAMRVNKHLLVSGTAAITGEDSVHAGDLQRQLRVTLDNLASLVDAAYAPTHDALSLFRSLRVYHQSLSDRTSLAATCEARFPNAAQIEFVTVELCRPELLVEIEGVATESSNHG